MKKSFLKELLDRRVPQIVGSYFVGATTLIVFMDWLVTKYGFSDYYTSLALFGVISIMPSVVILAYFHGAPGKDEWTKVEKFGIPINIFFIAIALFTGYKYNLWQEEPFDYSANDTFLVHLSSPEDISIKFESVDFYIEGIQEYADQTGPVDPSYLNEIQAYININLKKEFRNHENLMIYYPETEDEKDMLDDFTSIYTITNMEDEVSGNASDYMIEAFDYFNTKHSTHIDKIIIFDIMKVALSDRGKTSVLFDTIYSYAATITKRAVDDKGEFSTVLMGGGTGVITDEEGDGLKENLFKNFVEEVEYFAFGEYIGKVDEVLDSDLVTIKLETEGIIKGTDLVVEGRDYIIGGGKDRDAVFAENLRDFIDDYWIVYNYFIEHPDKINEFYYENMRKYSVVETKEDSIYYSSVDNWIDSTKAHLDYYENNFDKFIAEYPPEYAENWYHGEFSYYLKVLKVDNGVATARITGSKFPFSKPKVGDNVNIK